MYKLIFIANTYLMLFVVYLINKGINITSFLRIDVALPVLDKLSCIIYVLIPVTTTFITSLTFTKLNCDSIPQKNITKCEPIGSTFLVTFFAYIFIGLSVDSYVSLTVVYAIVILLCAKSEIYMYNPLYHLFGYNYYYVYVNESRFLVMTKKDALFKKNVSFEKLAKISSLTYVDIEEVK